MGPGILGGGSVMAGWVVRLVGLTRGLEILEIRLKNF